MTARRRGGRHREQPHPGAEGAETSGCPGTRKTRRPPIRTTLTLFVVLVVAGLGWVVVERLREIAPERAPRAGGEAPIPVEVAEVESGPIELRRTLAGTLEPSEEFEVAPRVNGRVVRLLVNIADPVENGCVVAELNDEEFQQELAQREADLAVARANLVQAESARVIADRAMARVRELEEQGVASAADLDAAQTDVNAKQAGVEVARAQITRAEATLETAKIRLGYTRVTVAWTGGDGPRVVSERYVDVGDTVAANSRLLSIVDLNPLKAVVFVTERDYARLRPGQLATLTTDMFPGDAFPSEVRRIAPVFRASSRQARVELEVDNGDHRLRPGMFISAEVVLDRVEDAFIVPVEAVTTYRERTGVFVVDEGEQTVTYHAADVGIRQPHRVQLLGPKLDAPGARVVTLGQQLLTDGARILMPETPVDPKPTPGASREGREAPTR